MTRPPDPTPPVYLPEPPARPGQDAPPPPPAPPAPPPSARAPRPRTLDEPPLHPGWGQVLPPDETVVWQGRPRTPPQAGQSLPGPVLILMVAVLGFMAVASGSPLPVLFGIVVFLLMRRRARANAAQPRQFVLTDRAAYSARASDRGLDDVACCPLDDADEPRRKGRGLRLETRRGKKRDSRARRVDFDDIDDLDDVMELIRDLRRGKDR